MKLSFVICIISALAIAPTKGETMQHVRFLGDGSCSPEGEKSTACGAKPRDDRAEMCCPGLKCGGENDKVCVEDTDKDDGGDGGDGSDKATSTADATKEDPELADPPAGDDGTGKDSPVDDSTSPAHITTLSTLHAVVGIIAIISVSCM